MARRARGHLMRGRRRLIHVIRAVVFDLGKCIVNESREYGTWADRPGVPRHTFWRSLGVVIARGVDYSETFQVFRPGFDLDESVRQRRRPLAGRRLHDLHRSARW